MNSAAHESADAKGTPSVEDLLRGIANEHVRPYQAPEADPASFCLAQIIDALLSREVTDKSKAGIHKVFIARNALPVVINAFDSVWDSIQNCLQCNGLSRFPDSALPQDIAEKTHADATQLIGE